MKQSIFTILSNTPLTDCVYKMVLSGDTSAITAPGQFVNIQITGKFLRRPISVCDYDGDTLTIVYKVVGKGTEILSRMVPGEKLDILGPLGNGFPEVDGPILVVGGGIGVPPMYLTAKRNHQADAVLGFRSKEKALLLDRFQEICGETLVMTDDGSLGKKGFVAQGVAEMLKKKHYAAVMACGPKIMLKTT